MPPTRATGAFRMLTPISGLSVTASATAISVKSAEHSAGLESAPP